MGDGSEVGDPDRTQGWKGYDWGIGIGSGTLALIRTVWARHARASFSLHEESLFG